MKGRRFIREVLDQRNSGPLGPNGIGVNARVLERERDTWRKRGGWVYRVLEFVPASAGHPTSVFSSTHRREAEDRFTD